MSNIETLRVVAPDGVETALRMSGPGDGPGVILIHGILHCSLVWKYQFADPAFAGVRLGAYDVRGHGAADKPPEADYYQPDRFAEELNAVIKASGMKRPVLLGWSLGTRMICNYLHKYGPDQIGGFAIVGGRVKQNPNDQAPGILLSCSDDLETRVRARAEFLRRCHEIPPAQDDHVELVACSMMTPPDVLRHYVGRPMDFEALVGRLTIPMRVLQGERDMVCPVSVAARIPQINARADMTVYQGIGHAPFFEQPSVFNRDLIAFIKARREEQQR